MYRKRPIRNTLRLRSVHARRTFLYTVVAAGGRFSRNAFNPFSDHIRIGKPAAGLPACAMPSCLLLCAHYLYNDKTDNILNASASAHVGSSIA